MIDPLTATVMIVLGKYALDKGVELAREVGPAAAKKAGELFATTLDYLRRDPNQKVVADEFEDDPATYEKPVEKKLDEAVQADAAFAAQLKELLSQYEAAAKAHAAAAGTMYQATLKGSGAMAQGPGATAVGERGVQVGGTVGGSIITGDRNVVGSPHLSGTAPGGAMTPLPPALENLRQKISAHFNVEELKNLCQDMNITHENLGGEGREGQVRELIDYCGRHGRIETLIAECKRRRPNVDWA
ncbi:MAG: hypothetical protein L0332_33040 [Chloroflexi bacterium]|nr:hypothetical protein [Chloroflexota bacterium]